MIHYKHLPSPVKFREDINGLRAWAVIAVLLFHFSLIGLPGGFAGVDVFFVISGYLMTAIIVGGYEKGNFSIWKFYMARARRILPALLVVIAVLLALGWFWLPTPDYQALGAQSAFGMSFLSNIYYWRSAGYFDSAAEEKWLLHTWSLAVEAQFYVLYPIFIALVWKFWKSLKAITIGILILFISSLVLNLVVTGWNPSGAFYLLPTRGWELAAGGLVYLIAKQGFASESVKRNGYWLGWILVVASFFFITEHLAWPGYWAILPVFGTSLIILGQRESCKLTDNAVAQWLGDRSYSLYLWHWPLVVALYFASLQNEWSWVIGAFALSILLAHLSYKFVETPTRQFLSASKTKLEVAIIAGVMLILVGGGISVKIIGFENRSINETPQAQYITKYSREQYIPQIREAYKDECNFFDDKDSYAAKNEDIPASCVTQSSKSVFLWGDSHAQALSFGLRKLLSENYPGVGFSQVASSGCVPNLSETIWQSGEFKKACDRSNKLAYESVRNIKPKLVVLAQQKDHIKTDLILLAQQLLKDGVKFVLIVGPVPQWNIDLPRIIARKYWESNVTKIKDGNFKSDFIAVNNDLKRQIKMQDNQRILFASPLDELCDKEGYCLAVLDKAKTPLVFDYGHLTIEGSELVANQVVSPILQQVFGGK